MKATHTVNYGGCWIDFQIAKTGDGKKWSYRQVLVYQDQRGITFDEIRRLPGHWRESYPTRKAVIAMITNDGKYEIEKV